MAGTDALEEVSRSADRVTACALFARIEQEIMQSDLSSISEIEATVAEVIRHHYGVADVIGEFEIRDVGCREWQVTVVLCDGRAVMLPHH